MRPETVDRIDRALDDLFERLKGRYLGLRAREPGDKVLRITVEDPRRTLAGLAVSAASEQGAIVSPETLSSLVEIAESYMDAAKATARSHLLAEAQGARSDGGLSREALGGRLVDVWGKVTTSMERIMESTAQKATSMGAVEGITLVNAQVGIDDPTVFFVVVRDGFRCRECTRLHLMSDGVTPRCWKMSEVGHSYHKKGDPFPKASGLHNNCRCRIATLLPGYGFDASGMVKFISPNHDELAKQRGGGELKKYEHAGECCQ